MKSKSACFTFVTLYYFHFRLVSLYELNVSQNALTSLPNLDKCTKLARVIASHNLITDFPSSLPRGENSPLAELDFRHNQVCKFDSADVITI
jgi:hypothetical protein